MEILINNPLATMYGPYFLIFFGFRVLIKLIAKLESVFRQVQFKFCGQCELGQLPFNDNRCSSQFLILSNDEKISACF